MNWTLLHAALLRALNSPVLDLILRVRDGRRVPDELEPGGRVGLQLEEVRGRGGSWKYFNILWRKYFNVLILLSSAISVTTRLSGKISGTFSNIWKFNKNHKSLNLNILSVSSPFPVCVCLCLCLANLWYWLHSTQTRIYWESALRREGRFHSRFWRQQRNCRSRLLPNHWSLWQGRWSWGTEIKYNY